MGCRTGLEPATTRITIWGSTIELPTPFSVVVRQTLPVLFHFGKKKMSLMSFLNGIFSQLYNKNMIGRLFVSHLENYGETVWSSIAPSWIWCKLFYYGNWCNIRRLSDRPGRFCFPVPGGPGGQCVPPAPFRNTEAYIPEGAVCGCIGEGRREPEGGRPGWKGSVSQERYYPFQRVVLSSGRARLNGFSWKEYDFLWVIWKRAFEFILFPITVAEAAAAF